MKNAAESLDFLERDLKTEHLVQKSIGMLSRSNKSLFTLPKQMT
jgi:hypothetical protein